jgi:hypothetical protein
MIEITKFDSPIKEFTSEAASDAALPIVVKSKQCSNCIVYDHTSKYGDSLSRCAKLDCLTEYDYVCPNWKPIKGYIWLEWKDGELDVRKCIDGD